MKEMCLIFMTTYQGKRCLALLSTNAADTPGFSHEMPPATNQKGRSCAQIVPQINPLYGFFTCIQDIVFTIYAFLFKVKAPGAGIYA